jgi:hypothetical protein
MCISNFSSYKSGTDRQNKLEENEFYNNAESLNILVSVFVVMFIVFNSMIMQFVYTEVRTRAICISFLFLFQTISVIVSNFDFSYMSYQAWVSIVVAIFFTMILIPAYLKIVEQIQEEGFSYL